MRFARWVRKLFRRRCRHVWQPFQFVTRQRCYRCGVIRDLATDDRWASFEDYLKDRRM